MMQGLRTELHCGVSACMCVWCYSSNFVFVLDIYRTFVWSFSNLDLYATTYKRQQRHCNFWSFICPSVHVLFVR